MDLHFHGLYGIDLMRAQAPALQTLSARLWKDSVHCVLPTTISSPLPLFEAALERLGSFIEKQWLNGPESGSAFFAGIHLEGPFLAQSCCGAHPPEFLMDPSLTLLKRWWEISRGTIVRLTLAPERGEPTEVRSIIRWARARKISLSLGHSQADLDTARAWHRRGIRQLTHAWNAMPFHHRSPGPMGAFASAHPDTFIELIPDGVHVHPAVMEWTHTLHPKGVFWVSDAVPAGRSAQPASFGTLTIEADPKAPVCRTLDGHLAGGALPLSRLLSRPSGLIEKLGLKPRDLVWEIPWRALGETPRRLRWKSQLEKLARYS
jgi:N-acetylglucosamine-6-phosphate deacetylase